MKILVPKFNHLLKNLSYDTIFMLSSLLEFILISRGINELYLKMTYFIKLRTPKQEVKQKKIGKIKNIPFFDRG